MSTRQTQHGEVIFGKFEPSLAYTFLPGCRACGGSHPLARKGALDPELCPDCGAPAGKPGPTKIEKAVWGGFNPTILLGRFLLFIGRALAALYKRI